MTKDIQCIQNENMMTIYLHRECYSKEALLSFAYESSPKYSVYLDKENEYFKISITPYEGNIGDFKSIIDKINDYELTYELGQRTDYLRNVIIDYAFGKKKL